MWGEDMTIQRCPACKEEIDMDKRVHVCYGSNLKMPPTSGELYAKRKWKLFIIDQHEILKILMGVAKISNFPEGAVFADCGYRLDAQGFAVLVCHPEYEEVPNDKPAPLVPAEWRDV